MFTYTRPVWAEVNLDYLISNFKEVKKLSNGKSIIGVVKADAYGHGAIEVAHALIENGVDMLAVAVITEAVELRKSGITAPIMILGFTPTYYIEQIIKEDVIVTVYSYEYAEELSNKAKEFNKDVKIQIAVDTGMGRIGFLPNKENVDVVYNISKLENIKIESIFSHFSTADEEDKEYTHMQGKKFQTFCDGLEELGVKIKNKHIANSATIMDLPEYYHDSVRPGIILYGYYPSNEVNTERLNIKPIMSLKATIVHIKTVVKDEYISYGRKFKTERESIIATLPIGYADGYTRLLSGKAKVIVNGKFAPVVGKICMDQCMIDITDIEGVKLGDEVILMGEDNGLKITADDIAESIGTISYEVICMINKRVPRVYLKNGEVVKIRNYV
jgi:alanine racemase